MSLMCKMTDQCCATKGMCVHEKVMMVIAMIAALGAIGHWLLDWF
jgi:hypothetical protein